MTYYKQVELTEGTPVIFVGVHVLRWRPEWGEPSVGFMEADEIDDLRAKLDDAVRGFEEIATYPAVLNLNYAITIRYMKNLAREALARLEQK